MPATGHDLIDQTLQTTNLLLKDLEERMHWQGHRHLSYAALRAVLHTLRDRLTVEEAAEFAAQLPMLVKGIYYEGWEPASVPKKFDASEFAAGVRSRLAFEVEGGTLALTGQVLKSLARHVSPGELDDVLSMLPQKLATSLRQAIASPAEAGPVGRSR
jgi:uncharacterized protein (DUF2267 family)